MVTTMTITDADLLEVQEAFHSLEELVMRKLTKAREVDEMDEPVPYVLAEPPPTTSAISIVYEENHEDVQNPGRGWAKAFDIFRTDDKADRVRAEGFTLVHAMVNISAFMASDISSDFLTRLDAALIRLHAAGMQAVLRFRYSDSDDGTDAIPARMLAHVAQLMPVCAANAHAIHVLQVGMIGQYGEMHGSIYPENMTPGHRHDLTRAMLDGFPGHVATRRPAWIAEVSGDVSRLGVYDDCILCSDDDGGTWINDPSSGQDEVFHREKIGKLSAPFGGEVSTMDDPLTQRQGGENAIRVFEWMQLNYLHDGWNAKVIDPWRATPTGLLVYHHEIITRRMGYRFVLKSFEYIPTFIGGASNFVRIELRNDGFATLSRETDVEFILRDGDGEAMSMFVGGTSQWEPGAQQHVLSLDLGGWGVLLSGVYTASLSIKAPNTPGIQCANRGTWDPETEENILGVINFE